MNKFVVIVSYVFDNRFVKAQVEVNIEKVDDVYRDVKVGEQSSVPSPTG